MKYTFLSAALLLAFCATAAAQVEPAATRARDLIPPGNLTYSLRYSQNAQFGGALGDWQTSAVSGSLAYTNGNHRLPFSVQYGGGYNASLFGPSYGNGIFQHLALTQGLECRRWNLSLTDSVSVTPQAPTLGFTGIPGIGEPIAVSNPVPVTNPQSVLTVNTQVVDNNAGGQLSHFISHAVVLNAGGSDDRFRYPHGDGFDTNTDSGNGGLRWRLNGRNSLTSDYRYSQFSYPALNFSFQTQSAILGMVRTWTRRVSTQIDAGPQWTKSSNRAAAPASIGITVNAGLNYQSGYNTAGLDYFRGVSNGGGFYVGAETDTASADYTRRLSKDVTLGFFVSYMRTAGMNIAGATAAKDGGGQVTRRLGRYVSLFASYSLITQSTSSALPANTLGQMFQSTGFGIEYSPRESRLER